VVKNEQNHLAYWPKYNVCVTFLISGLIQHRMKYCTFRAVARTLPFGGGGGGKVRFS
jgi:hypothetical protein